MIRCRLSGFGLIEVLVGVAIVVAATTGVVAAYSFYTRAAFESVKVLKASLLLEEGAEAARLVRDASWTAFSSLSLGTPYYFVFDGTLWRATTTPTYVDGFVRTMQLQNAYRDASAQLATSGTLDANTRLVTISVSWFGGKGTTTQSIPLYLHRP